MAACLPPLCFIAGIAIDNSHNGAILQSTALEKQVQLNVKVWAVTR
jgi:hypothetical protein